MSEENTAQTESNNEATADKITHEPGNEKSEKTFTQSDVNSLLADQKRKLNEKFTERETEFQNKLSQAHDEFNVQMKEFSDYEELKTTVNRLDEIKAEAFENGKTEASKLLVGKLVETEIRSTAQALGFHDPSDALILFGDKDSVSYDPETGVDREAINTRLTELATQKTWMVKTDDQAKGTKHNLSRPGLGEGMTTTGEKPDRAAAALRQLKFTD